MHSLPEAIRNVIEQFDRLPGIGPKAAIKLTLAVVSDPKRADSFAKDLEQARDTVRFCALCQTLADSQTCDICSDTSRDTSLVCVVAHVQDIEPVERTGKFRGRYHVLHGTINPMEGTTPDHIKVKELISRITSNGITEVILALDATMDGEATSLYLGKLLKQYPVTISKLARGIPMGSNIEYVDEVTLSSALENRRKI